MDWMPVLSSLQSSIRSSLATPILSEGIHQALRVNSTLQELPLYDFQAELTALGTDVTQMFEQHPLLPGVILTDQRQFVGLLSRQRLLEYLLRPHGMELFLREPLHVLFSYARVTPLILAGSTAILVASQLALRRSFDHLGEPIVVQLDTNTYQLLDIRELLLASWQLRGIETQVRYEGLQTQMIRSERMASLGRLVDGVAHEILDPVSFIWGNLSHVSDYTRNLLELVMAYEKQVPQLSSELAKLREDIEIDYIREDLPKTLESIKTGAERLSKLASSLQNFCHIDEIYPKPADLHDCLDNVLLLLKSRLSGEIDIVKHYGNLPPVPCFISQLSQVFMNIFSRAIDNLLSEAISEQLTAELHQSSQPDWQNQVPKPQIIVTTEACAIDGTGARWVSLRIADNGGGSSAEMHQQLTELFASNLKPAKETSLTVSYRIVTAKHGGKFKVKTIHHATTAEPIGTEFELLLPLV
jgi:signal transduction histidine kinase